MTQKTTNNTSQKDPEARNPFYYTHATDPSIINLILNIEPKYTTTILVIP